MLQELYITGQQVDLNQNTDVTLEYKSNILGDISKIEGSHSYSISLPKTTNNLRILQDPGNPARNAGTVRRYLNARYYRNGIDLFGDCRAVVLGVNEDSIEIALTMQGLRSLAQWSEAGKSIKDLFTPGTNTQWSAVSSYEAMKQSGLGIAAVNTGVDLTSVTEVYYPPAVSLNGLFTRIMGATGVTRYLIPAEVQDDMKGIFIPFVDYIAARPDSAATAGAVATGKREPERDAVHLNFSNWDYNPTAVGWNVLSEAFRIPENADTFLVTFYTVMPAGTFRTEGPAYFRIIGSDGTRDVEIYSQPIQVNPDGSALIQYTRTEGVEVGGYTWVWLEVSNTEEGTHASQYENSYTFLFQGQKARRGEALLISRNLPDIRQLDLLKFICSYYGLAILPVGIDGLSFVPYSIFRENKAAAVDWSDRLTGATAEDQRGSVAFSLSDFAQRNILKWTADDSLEYTPAQGELVVDDRTLQNEKTLVTLPFAASYRDKYPLFSATRNDDGTHDVTLNGLKPRIFRLQDQNGSAALYFTGDLTLPARIQDYYKDYQEIIREPITQTVNCRLNELDLRRLDFTLPVYFRQFGKYYAIESVRTSSKTDVCEIKLIQI